MYWLDFIFPPRPDELILRNVSQDGFLARAAPRLAPDTRPGTVVLLPFNDQTVRAAIHEAKYHGSERAFSFLALVLAEYLRDADDLPSPKFDLVSEKRSSLVLIPVPLGKKRLKERGFNQVEEVTKRAAKELNTRMETGFIVRTRETESQVLLPREEREKNMRGAFTTTPKLRGMSPDEISRTTFILIDDVLTTGATLQAAIDTLKKSGVKEIIPLALAH